MGKKSEKLYIRHSERQSGYKAKTDGNIPNNLPFDHCMLTFRPLKNPVCTDAGHIYEHEAVLEYILENKYVSIEGSVWVYWIDSICLK